MISNKGKLIQWLTMYNTFVLQRHPNVFHYMTTTAGEGLRTWAIIYAAWLYSEIRELVEI